MLRTQSQQFLFFLCFFLLSTPLFAKDLPLEKIILPEGFDIKIYAEGVPNARAMALSDNGVLFVGSRKAGRLYAVLDHDKDHYADQVIILAKHLEMPVGVALRDGDLYVSALDRVLKFKNIEDNLRPNIQPIIVNKSFPNERSHGWKFIDFGPDGKLYVPVGAPCNICENEDPRFASIMRMNPDGSELEIFARGVRNTVGFTWHPETGEMWFTDNGRDWLGDDFPPDELNHAPREGMHFGYPYCHGGGLTDPKFGNKRPCSDFTPTAQELGPHVASLGLTFYEGEMFPQEYYHQVFIAEHGSWNRSTPLGYRVTFVRLEGDQAIQYEVFAEGWLDGNGKAWGRPVDVLIMPDGSMLVSDDHAGVIYRITYTK